MKSVGGAFICSSFCCPAPTEIQWKSSSSFSNGSLHSRTRTKRLVLEWTWPISRLSFAPRYCTQRAPTQPETKVSSRSKRSRNCSNIKMISTTSLTNCCLSSTKTSIRSLQKNSIYLQRRFIDIAQNTCRREVNLRDYQCRSREIRCWL